MSETVQPGWFAQAFLYTLGVVVTLLTAIFEYYRRKVDDMQKSHTTFVTREELATLFEKSEEDSDRKHTENRQDRAEDRVAMVNLAQRIDRALERMK